MHVPPEIAGSLGQSLAGRECTDVEYKERVHAGLHSLALLLIDMETGGTKQIDSVPNS